MYLLEDTSSEIVTDLILKSRWNFTIITQSERFLHSISNSNSNEWFPRSTSANDRFERNCSRETLTQVYLLNLGGMRDTRVQQKGREKQACELNSSDHGAHLVKMNASGELQTISDYLFPVVLTIFIDKLLDYRCASYRGINVHNKTNVNEIRAVIRILPQITVYRSVAD